MSTRKITSPAMEVIQGEMYIFGEKLPRHPEFPWLFSATALHKSCEEAIKLRTEQNGKDPEKFYKAKRPGEWIRFNILGDNNQERIEQYAKHTRARIKKYGPNLGFGLKKSDAINLASQIDSLTDLQVVCVTAKGTSSKVLQGSYLCQLAIVKYIETFSEKFRATVQNSFISMVNGEVETVTEEVEANARKARGTPTRLENKQLQYELIRACGEKKLLPIKPQQGINEGVLGMTGAKYKKYFGVPEPLNDNLSVKQVQAKNVGMILATRAIDDHKDKIISQEAGVEIGRLAALKARVLLDSSSINSKLEKLALKLKDQDAANLEKLEKDYKAKKHAR